MMSKNNYRVSIHLALLLTVILVFFCVSCGSTLTNKITPATATPTVIHQPISGQQLLAGPLTYIALGASDAVGVGSEQPAAQGYVPLLEQRLPKGSHLINLGISGIRLHAALTQELPIALSTNPQLVTIWLVANDFVGGVPYNSYIADLATLLQQLRSGTQARIVMANLPDLTLLPAFANLSAARKASMLTSIKQWNAGIAAVAARYNVAIVDLFSQRSILTSHPQDVSGDGFHPSALGYALLANDFWLAIQ